MVIRLLIKKNLRIKIIKMRSKLCLAAVILSAFKWTKRFFCVEELVNDLLYQSLDNHPPTTAKAIREQLSAQSKAHQ